MEPGAPPTRAARALLLAISVAALACAGPPALSTDAAPDTAASDAGTAPLAIAPPAAPVLTPCAPGWTAIEVAGAAACDPWPDGAPLGCAAHEAHFPGAPSCARVGTACAPDGWPGDLPSGRAIVFVDAAAGPGGDGSTRATALATIADAIAAAAPGAVIALRAGSYDVGDVAAAIDGDRTLWGACPERTIVTSSVAASVGAAIELGAGGGVRNLAIAGSERAAIVSTGAGTSIDAVVISSPRVVALAVLAGSCAATDLVVREVRSDTGGTLGRGVDVEAGASLTIARASIERARDIGLYANGVGARVTGTDVAIRDLSGIESSGDAGRCVQIQAGGRVELTRAALERGRQSGVIAADRGSLGVFTDVVVRDTQGRRADGSSGRGLSAGAGSRFELSRVLVDRSREGGIAVSDGSSARLSDVLAARTLGRASDGTFGRGITASARAALELDRVIVSEARELGVSAFSGAEIGARDVRVLGSGRGVAVQDGATATLERAVIDGSREAGVLADAEGTVVSLTDVEITDTRGTETDLRYGFGLLAQLLARVEARRLRVRGARMAGLAAVDAAQLSLDGLEVEGVLPEACAETTCADGGGGFALSGHFGAVIVARDFVLSDAALCGVVVGQARPEFAETSVDLDRGLIDRAPVGACVQLDGYDTSRLQRGVRYASVGVPLQATSYSLPSTL